MSPLSQNSPNGNSFSSITVIGGGSWGTAIAFHLARKGYPIRLWVYESDVARSINEQRENHLFLPGFRLPKNIEAFNDIHTVMEDAHTVVVVVPSNFYRRVVEDILPYLSDQAMILSASKGIEENSLKLMTQILEDLLPVSMHDRIACLSGPSFAREVADEKFTAVTVASRRTETALYFQNIFHTSFFRTYTHHDPIGVQLGGALKNIIAIAVGIVDGMEMGTNARAALITRGLAEISRIGDKLGADPTTFLGLSGIGDLVLTCTGNLSRNRNVGLKLGRGLTIEEITKNMRMVAEGISNTRSAYQLVKKLNVRAPVITGMYKILYQNTSLERALEEILSSAPKGEFD